MGAYGKTRKEQLTILQDKLIAVLEEINQIRPVQFLDWESEYVYNFIRLRESVEDDRIYIDISGCYDNLPSHVKSPLCGGRNRPMPPLEDCRQAKVSEEDQADMLTGKELDAMSPEQVRAYIDSVEFNDIDAIFEGCSFACIKRVYEKYYGFRLTSTKSRERAIFEFKETKRDKHRTELLLGV